MGTAIGQSLPIAIAILISPSAIVAITLMLMSVRARFNAAIFLFGWFATILVLGGLLLLLAGATISVGGSPPTWVAWVKIGLGALSLYVAITQWRARAKSRDQEPHTPGWISAIDAFTPVKALGLAAALVAINPKSLLIVISGAATIAAATANTGDQLLSMVVFAAVGSLGVATPPVIYLTMRSRATKALTRLRRWLGVHEHTVVAVIMLIIAVKLLVDGIGGL